MTMKANKLATPTVKHKAQKGRQQTWSHLPNTTIPWRIRLKSLFILTKVARWLGKKEICLIQAPRQSANQGKSADPLNNAASKYNVLLESAWAPLDVQFSEAVFVASVKVKVKVKVISIMTRILRRHRLIRPRYILPIICLLIFLHSLSSDHIDFDWQLPSAPPQHGPEVLKLHWCQVTEGCQRMRICQERLGRIGPKPNRLSCITWVLGKRHNPFFLLTRLS